MNADWLSVQDALARVMSTVSAVETETCDLRDARGRVLAEALISPVDLPVWTNSAMDGYAVRAADVAGATAQRPIELPVVDDIPAGGASAGPLPQRSAARVMTGAPVPEGADTVIRKEHTDGGRSLGRPEASVRILDTSDAGKNLRFRGEEMRRNDVALEAGTPLEPASIGLAASLGYAAVRVHRRPRIGLMTSGDELVELADFDQVLRGRKIVSSNSYSLRALIEEAGCEVLYLGIARDALESVTEAMRGAAGCDALVTSAGVSVGEHDYVRSALTELGARFEFWRVRMRPGSPFAFATVRDLGGIPWFGLPGNPVSSLVTGELFLRPALLALAGHRRCHRRTLTVSVREAMPAAPNLMQFVRVRLERNEAGQLVARSTGAQGSGMLSSLAAADALLILPENLGAAPGDTRRALPLSRGLASAESEI